VTQDRFRQVPYSHQSQIGLFLARWLTLKAAILQNRRIMTSAGELMKAIWHGTVLAESDQTIMVEGNHYFPPNSIKAEYFRDSTKKTMCHWKGRASYYDVVVDGDVNHNAAWYYPTTSAAAAKIADHVAFWNGIQVIA
jgi:uncharacterized protein (DUF427 family)